MKNTKKVLSVFLALIMIISIIPMSNITASAATTPSSVSSTEAYNKIYELFENLGDKSFFTTTHTSSCGTKSSSHSCSYCKLSSIITQTWFKNKFGTLSVSQFPKTYYPSGEAKGPDGWSCFGFASFAEWYVFKTNTTDKVTTKYVGTFDSNYSNASSNAKVGDLIRFGSAHSGIVISCDSTGIKVLDCNWGNVTYNCQIQIHTVRYSNYSTFTISRATNSFASSSTPTPETCSCSTSYAGNYTCTTTNSSLYIRSGHGSSYSAIGSIPKGATVYVSKANGSWAHVTYNGVSGYASMSYLTKQTTQKSTLSLSADTVYLRLGGTETATVNITINKNDSRGYTLSPSRSNSNISTSWGDWNGTTAPLYIMAKSQGTTVITIDLLDYETKEKIDTAYITVNVSANTYLVSYNANGGTGAPASQTKTHGTALTLSSTKPTRTGYTFLGWSTSSTATSATYSAGGSFTTNVNTTLYAVWQKNPMTVSSISVATKPTKTEYYVGDTFSSSGLSIKVNMSDGTTKTLTSGFTVSSPNMTTAGNKTVTVTYEGKTASFTIKVVEKSVTPDADLSISIQEPSRTTIRYKDGIVLHAIVEGELPEEAKVKWAASNDNFEGGYTEDGLSCLLVSKNNGYTTVVAVICDADDNIIATDTIEMRSKAGFFDKIGGFFRNLFGSTKIYEY